MNKIGKLIAECSNECEGYDEWVHYELNSYFNKKSITGYWLIIGHNTDWQARRGYMYKKAESGKDLICVCISGYGDCHIIIHNYGKGFYINAKHHDCPVNGTSFYCTPVSYKTFDLQPRVEV